ncbi:MAG: carbohydrate-binding domain-containing protein [Bacteroidaceae bacterium]|nr:carbohydrate-binding domain-containing protein [Bacteroidaceae bacterium]
MKNVSTTLLLLLLAPCFASAVLAQEQVRVWKMGDSKRFTTSEMLFSDGGQSFSVGDSTYNCASVDSITVVHTVTVTFNGSTASVDLGHARNVTYTIDGAHVDILSTNTTSELEFVLQGQSSQGSLTYEGPLKCKFYMNGLNLKSDRGAAIDIQCGKRIDLILNPGTVNVLEDCAGGEQKAAFYCKGHLEVSGSGSLTVSGNTRHGIATKEYMELKRSTGTITVNKAVNDAMHIGQYFKMNGGTLNLSGMGADGLQVEEMTIVTETNDTIPNPDKEDNGMMFLNGGEISLSVTGIDTKGIKVPHDLTVTACKIGTVTYLGGERITINPYGIFAQGNGSKGIQVGGNMLVNQDSGTTEITVRAEGKIYEYEEWGWDDEEEEWGMVKHTTRCMGIKVAGNLTINAGVVAAMNIGSGSYAIRVNGVYYKAPEAIVKGTVKTGE